VLAAVTGFGSFANVHLGRPVVHTYRDAALVDKGLARLLHLALLLEGIYVAPRLMMCTSTAMDDATIDEMLAGFRRAIGAIRPRWRPETTSAAVPSWGWPRPCEAELSQAAMYS
jgi:glutamate-1-semialdehyde aminotransferase